MAKGHSYNQTFSTGNVCFTLYNLYPFFIIKQLQCHLNGWAGILDTFADILRG